MNYRAVSAISIFILTFAISICSQTREIERAQQEQQRRREELDRERRGYLLDKMSREGLPLQKTVFQGRVVSDDEANALRKTATAPATEDVAISRDFLKQPNTGIFRLFPDKNCLEKGIIRADNGCAEIFPETWFYSFREKDYSNGLLFDLSLKDGKLYSDGFLSLGILANLGNFSLDKVELSSGGAKFISEFSPMKNASDIKRQYEEFEKGIEADGHIYSRSVKAELGGVYILRVIAYDVQKKILKNRTKNGGMINEVSLAGKLVDKDKREDITVAFRIIKKSKAGDLTIIWKELSKRKSPEVIFSN